MRRSFAYTILLNSAIKGPKLCANASCLEANRAALGDNAQTLLRGSSNPILGNVNDLLRTKDDAAAGCQVDVSTCSLKNGADCSGSDLTTYQDLTVDRKTGTISFDSNGVAGSIVEYCLYCKDTVGDAKELKHQYYLLSDDPATYSFVTECATLNPNPVNVLEFSSFPMTYDSGGSPLTTVKVSDAFTISSTEKYCDISYCTIVEGSPPSSCSNTPIVSTEVYFEEGKKGVEDGKVKVVVDFAGGYDIDACLSCRVTNGLDYVSQMFSITLDGICASSVYQMPSIENPQIGSHFDGTSGWQVFSFPYFTTSDPVCTIESYQLSSDLTTVVSIPELSLVDTGSGMEVRREITDGNVYDHTFYIHVDGLGISSNSFGPFYLNKFPYCISSDVIPDLAKPDLFIQGVFGSTFTDLADQAFMSSVASTCTLQSCQVMDISGTSQITNSDIQLSAAGLLQVNYGTSSAISETVSVSCSYTDITIGFANVVQATNSFLISLSPCYPETFQQGSITSPQSGHFLEGENAFQMFQFNYFTTDNPDCSIDTQQLSSDPTAIVPIPDLSLVDTGSGNEVRRDITDGNVYDFSFYVHVHGSGATTSFGPFLLQKFPYCTSSDITPAPYPDLFFQPLQQPSFTDVSDQNFMSTASPSCLLQSCQVMDSSCTTPTTNPYIQFSAAGQFQVNLGAPSIQSETVCVSCTYTDTTIGFANAVQVTNSFTVSMPCYIIPPPLLPESQVLTITDSSSTGFVAFSLGGEYSSSDAPNCPITGLFHADSQSGMFVKAAPFTADSSTYSGSDYVSQVSLSIGSYSFFLRSVASQATLGDVELSSAELTLDIFCDPSVIVPSVFNHIQTAIYSDGVSFYHRFSISRYSSLNVAECDILSYSLSSDPTTITWDSSLTLDSVSSPQEIFIEREFSNDFNLAQFYLHVETNGGDFSATQVSQQLTLKPPCTLDDILISEIEDQTSTQASGFVTIEQFSSSSSNQCQLEGCEVRESQCLSTLDHSGIFFDNGMVLNYDLSQVIVEDVCLMCQYTDSFYQVASVTAFSNVFKVTVSPIILDQPELTVSPTTLDIPEVTVSPPPLENPDIINMPPQFEENLPLVWAFNKTKSSSELEVFNYTLPEARDMEDHTFDISIISGMQESFMKFVNNTFFFEVKDQTGPYTIDIELVDELKSKKQYKMSFQFVQKPVDPPAFVFVPLPEEETSPLVIESPPCTVKFVEITPQSEAYLEFSTDMKADIDIKNINTDILDVYVESSQENLNFNLTWKVKSFKGRFLVLDLEFDQIEEISVGFVYDNLVVHFKEVRDYFISKEYLKDLSEDYRTVKAKIPKLLAKNGLSLSVKGLATSIETTAKGTLVLSVLMNLILSGILGKFIAVIRALQLLTHLLMLKIIVPANVMVFMQSILPVTQYDYLEPYWTNFIIKIFRIDEEGQSLKNFGGHGAVTDQILGLGYENQLSLLGLGTISFFLLLYLIKMAAYLALSKRWERMAAQKNNVFFQQLIDIISESFFELMISGYLCIYQAGRDTFAERLSLFIGYMCLVLCSSILFLLKFQTTDQGMIYEGGSVEQKAILLKLKTFFKKKVLERPTIFEYYVYFFARRAAYCLIIFQYEENLQMTQILFLNLFSFMYLGQRGSPFGRTKTRWLVFNDFMIHLICFHMIFFAGLSPEPEQKEMVGSSMIWLMILMSVINFMDLFVFIGNIVKLSGVKCHKRYKAWKNQGKVNDLQEKPENIIQDTANLAQMPKKPRGLFENISQSSDDNFDNFGVVRNVDTPKFAQLQTSHRDFSFRVVQPDPNSQKIELPGLFKFEPEQIVVDEIKQQIIGEFEPILETLLEDMHIEKREHLMDLARSGKRADNLTEQERRRLRSEKKFIEYLEVLKLIWHEQEFFGEQPSQHIDEQFELYVFTEMETILKDVFGATAFFSQLDHSLSITPPLERGLGSEDITLDNFASLNRQDTLLSSDLTAERLEELYNETIEIYKPKLEISRTRNKRYRKYALSKLQQIVRDYIN